MSFDRKRFLGITVVEFSSSVGWNEEGSSVRIKLAPEDGESVTNANVGEIQEFNFGGFQFTGFLDRFIERHDAGGNFYEATLSDGKENLKKIDCVVNSLYGSTDSTEDNPVPNYFNVFRYYERNGYGASDVNDSGMKASMFVSGVEALAAQYGVTGNDGTKYSINLGDILENLPDDYRIPGPTINLLDAISLMCDDSGKLWRVDVQGTTITVHTRSMSRNGSVTGTIKSRSSDKKTIAWDAGTESTNNLVSNLVVFGGSKENTVQFNYMGPTHPFVQFWGYDINGTACISPAGYDIRTYTNPNVPGAISGPIADVSLPTIGIEDIVGGARYNTNTLELMCVMGSQEAWEFYLELGWPSGVGYSQVFLRGARDWDFEKVKWTNYGGAGTFPLRRNFSEKENDIGVARAARLYTYLRSMCEAYWGKQFLVAVNWQDGGLGASFGNSLGANKVGGLTVRNKLEAKTSSAAGDPKKTYNILPSSSGWVDPAYPIYGIPKEAWDGIFTDGRNKPYNWIRFPALPNTYIIDDSGPDVYTTSDAVYVKANVSDTYLEMVGRDTYVHLSIPQTPYYIVDLENSTILGNDSLSRGLFNIFFNATNIGTSDLFKTGFNTFTPSAAIIGFKATTNDVYGPWYGGSGNGSTKIQQDSSLVPWEFGSGANLGAAFAEVLKDINPVSTVETGSLTVVEPPAYNLGNSLGADGAVVTSVSANYGPGGITSTYSFRTFTGRFGVTSRYVLEKMKRQAIKQAEDRRNIYIAYMNTIARQQASYRAEMGAKIANFFLNFLGRRHDRLSPHSLILMGMGVAQAGYGGVYSRTKILGSSYKYSESVRDICKLQLDFIQTENKALASLDTLFTPFQNSWNGSTSLPKLGRILVNNLAYQSFTNYLDETYERIDERIDPRDGKVPTAITYNPYKYFVHFDCLANSGMNYWDNHNEPDRYAFAAQAAQCGSMAINVNAIALRGPIMLSGWGTELWYGKVWPDGGGALTNRFAPSTTSKGNLLGATCPWEEADGKSTGPVDLIWDSARGVWTSHDVIRVKPKEKIKKTSPTLNPAGRITTGKFYLYLNDQVETSDYVEIYNLSSKEQPLGLETLAYYSVFDNRWYMKGEGCHIRFWDKKTVESIYEYNGIDITEPGNNLNNPDSKLPYYIDFVVQETVGDPYLEKAESADGSPIVDDEGNVIYRPEHYCVDLIQTSGMSTPVSIPRGSVTCPDGTEIPVYDYLWFFHGLAKEVIPWEDQNFCDGHDNTTSPPTTDPPDTTGPPDLTTTETPGCYLLYNPALQENCYRCSQNSAAGESIQDTFTGPTACEDCSIALPSYNATCGTTTTTTTLPPDICYLVQDYTTKCWFCTTEPSPEDLIDGSYTECDTCQLVANSKNADQPECTTTAPPLCYIYLDPATGCWNCSQNPEEDPNFLEAYSTCEECQVEANSRNESYPECTTTTTSTTTPAPTTTTTTTTSPPGCVDVVQDVKCVNGQIVTTKVSVKACSAPLVAQQSNIMEIRLLKAELKAVTRKLMDIIEVLNNHNIKVFK